MPSSLQSLRSLRPSVQTGRRRDMPMVARPGGAVTEREVLPDRGGAAVDLSGVEVRVVGGTLLTGVDWRVEYGEHWAVLGRNGAGKSTLLSVVAAQRHPASGTATVLGHRLGRVDMGALRRHIGLVTTGQRLLDQENATAHTVVLTGHTG